MQTLIKTLLLALLLVSCGTSKDSRYRDISDLERPPILSTTTTQQSAAASTATDQQPKESYAPDESRIEKKQGKTGLADAVYLNDETPPQIKIKQPLDKAWNTVERGLKQSEIKITDHERDKAQYHVTYAPSSLFSFMKMDPKTIYLLTLKEDGNETTVTVMLAPEPNSGTDNKDNDNTVQLIHLLFDTLHDDLREE
jgi:uncharacterized lipoprotein